MADLFRGEISEKRIEDLQFGVKVGLQLAQFSLKRAEKVKRKIQEVFLEEDHTIRRELKTLRIEELSTSAHNLLFPKKNFVLGDILELESDEEEIEEIKFEKTKNYDTGEKIEETDEEENMSSEKEFEDETQMSFEDFQKFIALNNK